MNDDTGRLDWIERVNPIIFHKTTNDDDWGVVVAPHAIEDEYYGNCKAELDRKNLQHCRGEQGHEVARRGMGWPVLDWQAIIALSCCSDRPDALGTSGLYFLST